MRENPAVYRLSERDEILPITAEVSSKCYLSYYWYRYYIVRVLTLHYLAPRIYYIRVLMILIFTCSCFIVYMADVL